MSFQSFTRRDMYVLPVQEGLMHQSMWITWALPPFVCKPRGFWHLKKKKILSKYTPSFAPFVSNSPQGAGNFFILNVRTAPLFEHHCDNLLSGMAESCQNPLGCLQGALVIDTDWCITLETSNTLTQIATW